MNASNKRLSTEEWISRAREVHGDRYDYSLVDYNNSKTPVTIICPVHGPFEQQPIVHVRQKSGCPQCGNVNKGQYRKRTPSQFEARAREVHGDAYSYVGDYVDDASKVTIVCPVHGSFNQLATNHLAGKGCDICARADSGVKRTTRWIDRVRQMREVHGHKYQYVKPKGRAVAHDKITIICPVHGPFKQLITNHISGQGCPACASLSGSRMEDAIVDMVPSDVNVVRNARDIIPPLELDMYFPEFNIAIEFCGLYWHSEITGKKHKDYHINKYRACRDRCIRLITIFEDEFVQRRDIVERMILHLFGKTNRGAGGRQLTTTIVPPKEAREFLDTWHIQGFATAKYHYGAFDKERLVGVMSFGSPTRQKSATWELKRFASDDYTHPGMAAKLLSAFIKDYDPTDIVSFSDNRWFAGNTYNALGFVFDGDIPRDYSYVRNGSRFHKSGFRKSRIRSVFDYKFTDGETEWQAMQALKYDRIWDCGKKRWVLNRDGY